MSGDWAKTNRDLIQKYNSMNKEYQEYFFTLMTSKDEHMNKKLLMRKIQYINDDDMKLLRKSGEERKAELKDEIDNLNKRIEVECPGEGSSTGGRSGLALPSRLVF